MFAYSPVETENILYNPKYTFNNRGGSTSNRNQPSSSSCNNNYSSMLSVISDLQEREQHRKNLERFHEATLKRSQLKHELQRRHQLCAENERLCRERTEKQNALKKVEECNALRKFYELKSAQLKNPNHLSPPNTNPSLSSSSSSSSFASSRNSSRSKSSSIKQFQAAFKIHTFIKHFIEKRQTQRILASLIRLRSIQNRLSRLKSMNLKLGKLTFDPIHEDKVLPTSANNKAFLIYKESILRVLDQLANEFSDEFYLIRERRQFIEGIANDMLRELDHERDTLYNNYIHEKDVVDGFVII